MGKREKKDYYPKKYISLSMFNYGRTSYKYRHKAQRKGDISEMLYDRHFSFQIKIV
jgi:hypothetical protein